MSYFLHKGVTQFKSGATPFCPILEQRSRQKNYSDLSVDTLHNIIKEHEANQKGCHTHFYTSGTYKSRKLKFWIFMVDYEWL